ncbi:hypothetical protein ACN47E_005330 [Coniothyrium glycines]
MATVTIGRSYFEALLRRAQFHTTDREMKFGDYLSNHVTIAKAEHGFLIQAVRDYHLLKSVLLRGGLTDETLQTLLAGENKAMGGRQLECGFQYGDEIHPTQNAPVPMANFPDDEDTSRSESTSTSVRMRPRARTTQRLLAIDSEHGPDDGMDFPNENEHKHCARVPSLDKRTVFVSNLAERTTHKDLAGVIRCGRLLDMYIRNDRTACISFVEGAADFLAYTKRNDIYLNLKRLEFRWADRQFRVPSHVSNRIAGGATRNLVIRGIAGKLTADQIRDHLDHIHNLVVVDIVFRHGDAYISTNSIHNALFARTCLMSRTAYKGSRIEYYDDECAQSPPQRQSIVRTPVLRTPVKPAQVINQYALLDTGSDAESFSDVETYDADGTRLDGYNWPELVAI